MVSALFPVWVALGLFLPGIRANASAATFVDGAGLRIVGVTRYDDRDYNVRVLSAYLGRPIDIRMLLPVGYADHPKLRYPALYLFHGTGGVAHQQADVQPQPALIQCRRIVVQRGPAPARLLVIDVREAREFCLRTSDPGH